MKTILSILFISLTLVVGAQKKIAIIGGGMAGISAAHHLIERDSTLQITVFEKEAQVGGNAQTITTTNSLGQTVKIDKGPQYFSESQWKQYIEMLKEYGVYHDTLTRSFEGSIAIQHLATDSNFFVSASENRMKHESMSKLMNFLKFYKEANKVYTGNVTYSDTLGIWVESLKLKDEFKKEVVYPFLAATLGTTIAEIKKTSTYDIVALFAAEKALEQSEFKVLVNGMGGSMIAMAQGLADKGVQFVVGNAVVSVSRQGGNFIVGYDHGHHVHQAAFDYVVFATHPYQASRILRRDSSFDSLVPVLLDFPYFKARIAIHRDSSYVNQGVDVFMNIDYNPETNELNSSTMNLGFISSDYSGIYKSWVTNDQFEALKTSGMLIDVAYFRHPLISPQFNASNTRLKQILPNYIGLTFCGGWFQGLETQESALVSGQQAAEAYFMWLSNK